MQENDQIEICEMGMGQESEKELLSKLRKLDRDLSLKKVSRLLKCLGDEKPKTECGVNLRSSDGYVSTVEY